MGKRESEEREREDSRWWSLFKSISAKILFTRCTQHQGPFYQHTSFNENTIESEVWSVPFQQYLHPKVTLPYLPSYHKLIEQSWASHHTWSNHHCLYHTIGKPLRILSSLFVSAFTLFSSEASENEKDRTYIVISRRVYLEMWLTKLQWIHGNQSYHSHSYLIIPPFSLNQLLPSTKQRLERRPYQILWTRVEQKLSGYQMERIVYRFERILLGWVDQMDNLSRILCTYTHKNEEWVSLTGAGRGEGRRTIVEVLSCRLRCETETKGSQLHCPM